RVRRVDVNGIISTFAGIADPNATSPCGRNGDGGLATLAKLNAPTVLALDPQESALYILDSSSYVVRRVDLSTGIISNVAGVGAQGSTGDGGPATSARLSLPTGMAFDGAGELFIADTNLRTIRRIDTRGTITTVAGGGTGDGLIADVARTSPRGI